MGDTVGEPRFRSDLNKTLYPDPGTTVDPPEPRTMHGPRKPYYAGGYRILEQQSYFLVLPPQDPGGPIQIVRSYTAEWAFWMSGFSKKKKEEADREIARSHALASIARYGEACRGKILQFSDSLPDPLDGSTLIGGTGLASPSWSSATVADDLQLAREASIVRIPA